MWISYSLIFAFWASVAMFLSKRFLKEVSPIVFLVVTVGIALPFMLATLIITGVPSLTFEFFKFLFFASFIDIIAAFIYYKALEISEISLLAPISAFNPVFTLIFAWILLGEKPTPIKLAGIFVIVLGSYLINLKDIKHGYMKPFINLFSNRGVQLFLITNLLWGITPVFQKGALLQTTPSAPIAVPLIEGAMIFIILSPILFRKETTNFTKKNLHMLLFIGFMTTIAQFAAMSAFSLTNVGYAVAIFRLSALFTIVIGAVFLKEKNIKHKFIGASVMVLGTILIAL